jgi:hypothetical protein
MLLQAFEYFKKNGRTNFFQFFLHNIAKLVSPLYRHQKANYRKIFDDIFKRCDDLEIQLDIILSLSTVLTKIKKKSKKF